MNRKPVTNSLNKLIQLRNHQRFITPQVLKFHL